MDIFDIFFEFWRIVIVGFTLLYMFAFLIGFPIVLLLFFIDSILWFIYPKHRRWFN